MYVSWTGPLLRCRSAWWHWVNASFVQEGLGWSLPVHGCSVSERVSAGMSAALWLSLRDALGK